jgi:hypothetical protein
MVNISQISFLNIKKENIQRKSLKIIILRIYAIEFSYKLI